MWTADNRPRYNRDKLRYPSDLHAEWAHIEPLIPPGKPGGGKRRVAIREVIGVMYILSTGCQWRALPKDLPPRSTVHDYLGLSGTARWIASIMRSTSSAARKPRAKPAPRPASSTVRVRGNIHEPSFMMRWRKCRVLPTRQPAGRPGAPLREVRHDQDRRTRTTDRG